eukprot:tig00001154_g7297.t1
MAYISSLPGSAVAGTPATVVAGPSRTCALIPGVRGEPSTPRRMFEISSARADAIPLYSGFRATQRSSRQHQLAVTQFGRSVQFRSSNCGSIQTGRGMFVEANSAAGASDGSFNPYRFLGVSETAKFEEVDNAIKEMKEKYKGDEDMEKQIAKAENAILLKRLTERKKEMPKINLQRLGLGPRGKPTLPPNIQLPTGFPTWKEIKEAYRPSELLDQPVKQTMVTTGVIFGMLGVFSLISPVSVGAYLPLGLLCCIAYHYQKNKKWIRSIPFSMLAAAVGWALGTGLPKIGFPTFGLAIQAVVGVLTYILFWLVCNYIR